MKPSVLSLLLMIWGLSSLICDAFLYMCGISMDFALVYIILLRNINWIKQIKACISSKVNGFIVIPETYIQSLLILILFILTYLPLTNSQPPKTMPIWEMSIVKARL